MAYDGFKAVQNNIESEGKSPGASAKIAAAIGRKKYGSKRMAAMSAEARRRSGKGK